MTDRTTIELPRGVDSSHPDVQRLLCELAAVQPLPPKLTTRERLAEELRETYMTKRWPHLRAVRLDRLHTEEREAYLAEADAAIVFFYEVVRSAKAQLPVADQCDNHGVNDFYRAIESELFK